MIFTIIELPDHRLPIGNHLPYVPICMLFLIEGRTLDPRIKLPVQ